MLKMIRLIGSIKGEPIMLPSTSICAFNEFRYFLVSSFASSDIFTLSLPVSPSYLLSPSDRFNFQRRYAFKYPLGLSPFVYSGQFQNRVDYLLSHEYHVWQNARLTAFRITLLLSVSHFGGATPYSLAKG